MSDVFISYSRRDIAFARILHQALQERSLETWIDWQDIPPSVDWLVGQIRKNISEAAFYSQKTDKPKASAVNFYTPYGTVEFRSVRPQKSADELQLVYALIAGRLRYLKSVDGLIDINPPPTNPYSPKAYRKTVAFIKESGLDPELFHSFFLQGWGKELVK